MKKAIKFFGVSALALVIGFAIISCGEPDVEPENPHTHSYGNWTTRTAATCTEKEVQERTCSCGDKQTREVGEPLGHLAPDGIPATCTEAGNTGTGTCIRPDCDETVTGTPIPALGHDFGPWSETRAATCTHANERTRTCTRSCGLPGNTETDWTITFLGHQDGEWHTTKEPDCTTAGDRELRCLWWAECNYIMQTETASASLPSLGGHIWNWAAYVSGSGLRPCQRGSCSVTAGIGDMGPGGGIIFYASNFTFFQSAADTVGVPRYYLEASFYKLYTQQWASEHFLIPNLSQNRYDETDWGIGRGYKNNLIIIAHGVANDYNTLAFTTVRSVGHGNGTKDDWFIPSNDELYELIKQRDTVNEVIEALGQGNFIYGSYWSSSQGNINHALSQPNTIQLIKSSGYNVRPVRAFQARELIEIDYMGA